MAAASFSYSNHAEYAIHLHEQAYQAVDAAYADTRWERVRGALFSDWQLPATSRETMVRRLAEPARAVRRALEQLLALQREDDGSRPISDLIALMNCADKDAAASAAGHVYAISRNDGSIASQELVDALFRVTKSGDLDAQRCAIGALSHLSENEHGRMFIFRSGGLAEIIRMLRSPDESVVRYALTTLHRLLLHVEASRGAARQLAATSALTPLLLSKHPPKLLALAADSVHMLIFDDHAERNNFAMELDGVRPLIRLLVSYDDHPKVVYTAVRCVRALSAGQESVHLKHSLIERDALRTLYSNLVNTNDPRTRIAILACLRNLSDAVSNEEDHSVLLRLLLEMVQESGRAGTQPGHGEDEVMYACGVLSNLTCNNVLNKAAVCESSGIKILCDALRLRPETTDETVTEPALCALRHCTARHSRASHAQHDLVRCGGWEVLLQQLRTLRPPVAKAALGVARNAALLQENTAALVDSPLGEQLAAISQEILASAAAELRVDVQATSDDGVRMWELAEAAAGALHQLAANPSVALYLLADPGLLHVVNEVLESEEAYAADEVMQREMLGLVYQLTKTESGVRQVQGTRLREVAERCLVSPHPSVATYAAGVLRNASADSQHPFNGYACTLGLRSGDRRGIDENGYGNPNWDGVGGVRGAADYQHMGGAEMGEGYEPELFGYHNAAMAEENYGLERIDHSFRLPHNNSDWFDTDL